MQDPRQAPAPSAATSSLDAAILRFWEQFLREQVAAGRRDVGRMLEVALGLFFEWGVKNGRADQDKHVAVDHFLSVLTPEMARAERVLKAHEVPRGEADGRLSEPYWGVQVFFKQDGAQHATLVEDLQAPMHRRRQLVDYLESMRRQANAAQQIKVLLAQKLVADREMVAKRLKVLSPKLYQMGATHVASMPSPPEPLALEHTPTPAQFAPEPAHHWQVMPWRLQLALLLRWARQITQPQRRVQALTSARLVARQVLHACLHWVASKATPVLERALHYASNVRPRQ